MACCNDGRRRPRRCRNATASWSAMLPGERARQARAHARPGLRARGAARVRIRLSETAAAAGRAAERERVARRVLEVHADIDLALRDAREGGRVRQGGGREGEHDWLLCDASCDGKIEEAAVVLGRDRCIAW